MSSKKRLTNKRTLRHWLTAKPDRKRMNSRYGHDKKKHSLYSRGFKALARDAANNVYIDHIKLTLLKVVLRGMVILSTNGFARIEPWLASYKVAVRIRDMYPEGADQAVFRAKAKELAGQGGYVAVVTSNRSLHSIRMEAVDAEKAMVLAVKWWRLKGLDEYEDLYLKDKGLPYPENIAEFIAATGE